MDLEDIIKKLPKIFQDLARIHLKILLKLTREEVEKWVRLMLTGDYENAHKRLLAKMSTKEAIEDANALLEVVKQLNKQAQTEADMWREFFLQIFLILLGKIEE